MLLQYAREHHFPNPTFFVDDGVSGVTYDRPGFQAMLAEIEAGRVAVAIAKDLSRLGRNSALTGLYTNFTFPQNGVRFIAINDNYDTIDPNRVDNDFAGIKNWFNEFYARDTSRKIRAVQKAKGERGVPLTTNVPYGYVKDLENPRRWVVDPVAADVVKRIFDLCMKGRGPMQIANQLKADKVLTPSAYRALQGIKTPNKKPEDPCDWHSSTVVAILERREYTGCTVNFKTYTNSIWDKKQRDNPLEKQAIFPNTHEAIIEEAVFEKVQQVRQQRHRNKLTEIKSSTEYNDLEMSGSRAVWKEVLAVYAVKINTDPDNPQEVASMDDTKKQLLSDIFWEMNEVSSRTESKTETVIEESDDGNGNIVETETTETKTILYITVSHKTVDEMADQYGFSQEQRDYLAELLKDENNSLWAAALYGIRTGDGEIVTVALSQIGNAGGEPYWSWYGFSSRVEWCACFVSWCANECGYIDAGVIPKFAGCVNGVNWFKERGQWLDGSEEPVPGMIIFFDWDNKGSSGPQDGESDHVGIVERVEDGRVYTVEGNSGDSCRENSYVIGHYEIYGYGVPAY